VSSVPKITVGGATATNVVVNSDTEIVCDKPAGAAGSHFPIVEFPGYGYVKYDAAVVNTIDFTLEVLSVDPAEGSIAGGTNIVITGTGFLSIPASTDNSSRRRLNAAGDFMTVAVNSSPCTVTSSTGTEIQCTTTEGTVGDDNT
jgi:hypothetical protein